MVHSLGMETDRHVRDPDEARDGFTEYYGVTLTYSDSRELCRKKRLTDHLSGAFFEKIIIK